MGLERVASRAPYITTSVDVRDRFHLPKMCGNGKYFVETCLGVYQKKGLLDELASQLNETWVVKVESHLRSQGVRDI